MKVQSRLMQKMDDYSLICFFFLAPPQSVLEACTDSEQQCGCLLLASKRRESCVLGTRNCAFRQIYAMLCWALKCLICLDTRASKQEQCLKPSAHGTNRDSSTGGGLHTQCNAQCAPTSAPGRVMAKGMLAHDVYNSSSASHQVKQCVSSWPRRQRHASSCSGTNTGHLPPCAEQRGWSSTSRSSAAVSTKEKCLCLQPWISDQVGAGTKVQAKHIVVQSISSFPSQYGLGHVYSQLNNSICTKPDCGHRHCGLRRDLGESQTAVLPRQETPQQ